MRWPESVRPQACPTLPAPLWAASSRWGRTQARTRPARGSFSQRPRTLPPFEGASLSLSSARRTL